MRLSLPLIAAIAATVVPTTHAKANPAVHYDILLPTRDAAPDRHNPDSDWAISRGGMVTVVRATASLGPKLNRQTITLHTSYTETFTSYIRPTQVTIPAEEPSPPKDQDTTVYRPSATATPQPTSVKSMDYLNRLQPVLTNLDGLPACLVWHLQWSLFCGVSLLTSVQARCLISEQGKAAHDPNIQTIEEFCQKWRMTKTWLMFHLAPCFRTICPGRKYIPSEVNIILLLSPMSGLTDLAEESSRWLKEKCPEQVGG